MTTPVGIPNYQQLGYTYSGVEVVRGTKVAPTNPWYGRLDLQRRQPLAESEEFRGTFFTDYTPVRGAVMVDGTYYEPLAYEDGFKLRYAIAGGVAGVSDGEATPGYTYAFRWNPSKDTLDTGSKEYSRGGLIYESQGVILPEVTLSGDIDDAQAVWKLNARAIAISKELKAGGLDDVAATSGTTTTFVKTGWAQTIDALIGRIAHFKSGTAGNVGLFREILDNDATSITFAAVPSAVQSGDVIDIYAEPTAGISDRTREMIAFPGTRLWLLDVGGTPSDTNNQVGRFISFSVTANSGITYKRFAENVNSTSNKVDLGTRRVSGQVRLEFDRKREWERYVDLTAEYIRIAQEGSVIDSGAGTTKEATIDIYNAHWDDPTEDVRGNNTTVTFPFRGYVDTGEGVQAEFAFKHAGATLLA
jgi:hypothetical protein